MSDLDALPSACVASRNRFPRALDDLSEEARIQVHTADCIACREAYWELRDTVNSLVEAARSIRRSEAFAAKVAASVQDVGSQRRRFKALGALGAASLSLVLYALILALNDSPALTDPPLNPTPLKEDLLVKSPAPEAPSAKGEGPREEVATEAQGSPRSLLSSSQPIRPPGRAPDPSANVQHSLKRLLDFERKSSEQIKQGRIGRKRLAKIAERVGQACASLSSLEQRRLLEVLRQGSKSLQTSNQRVLRQALVESLEGLMKKSQKKVAISPSGPPKRRSKEETQ